MNLSDKIVIYQTKDGKTSIDVKLGNDTVWLSANQMAALFERDEKTIRKHINNVFSENELEKKNNTHFLRVDGVKLKEYLVKVVSDYTYALDTLNSMKLCILMEHMIQRTI